MNVKMIRKNALIALFAGLISALVIIVAFTEIKAEATKMADPISFSALMAENKDGTADIVKDGASDYVIVFSSSDKTQLDTELAKELSANIKKLYGVNVRYRADSAEKETANEILIGLTNRALSAELSERVDALSRNENLVFIISERDGKLAVVANSDEALLKARDELFLLLGTYGFSVTKELYMQFVMSRADYEQELSEKAEAERKAKIDDLKSKIAAFDDSLFGERTPMPTDRYNAPYTYPTVGQHPRLNLTSDMLPDIKRLLNDSAYSELAADFWEMANSQIDGVMPDVSTLNVTYNWDGRVLGKIEAKALAYLITGDELYAYEAIYAMKNHMLTLTLTHDIFVDIFRMYGWSMMVAGEVYDWCYDVMTDRDRDQFVRGVQKYYCEDCPCGDGDKMTIGFPPTEQSAVQGHGTNVALMRDYLAFSIAVFDEYPDWWELVGGRFYQEYVPANDVFYAAGMNTQGTNCYVWGKYYAQLYSAWLVKVMSGEMPYHSGIEDIAYGLMGLRLPNGNVFQSGDGSIYADGARQDGVNFDMYSAIYLVQALFPSEIIQRNARIMTQNYTSYSWGAASNYITPSTSLIFRAGGYDTEPIGDDKNEGLPLVFYHGSPMGQMTVRNDWSEDAAAVFMRVSEVTGANHDHEDAGTFQIYYKGCFTSESGHYAGYGSSHHYYWQQATIAHNGLLVYNPALANTERGWYSGGQEEHDGVFAVDEWLDSDDARTGRITGYDYYYNPFSGDVEYAYLAGDISEAYSGKTVEVVERRMLTLYTENADFPMFFVVYDYMKSIDASFKKSFLMHTATEPEIDGNTAKYTYKDGKIVLTTLTEDAVMTKIGGAGRTFWINDTVGNLNLANNARPEDRASEDTQYLNDGELWGRVQVDNTGKIEDHLLNVIYVTDAENESTLTPSRIENDQVIGMHMLDVISVFSKTENKNRATLSFVTDGIGLKRYFVSGLSEGSWTVRVDGVTVAHAHTDDSSGLIAFEAPTGHVVLEPGSDVRPENSDSIVYYTNGVPLPEDTKYFYTHGEEYVLPEIESTESRVFLGWYKNEAYTERVYSVTSETRGKLKLYARYYYTYKESYETAVFSIVQEKKSVNNYVYMAATKQGASFETVKDEKTGNTYMLWNAGQKDPQFYIESSMKDYLGNDTVVTFKLDIATDAGREAIKSMFRMRGATSQNTTSVFSVDDDGRVLLGGKSVITTLEDNFTTVIVSVDFEDMMLYAFDADGNVITKTALALSSADAGLTGIQYLESCMYLFDWYAPPQSSSDRALRIDNISLSVGFPENSNIPDPKAPNAIIYHNVDGAKLPTGTKYYYDANTETPLPETVIFGSGKEFLGWYSTPDFTERISAVPAGLTEQFNVYARWRNVFIESYEKTDIDLTNALEVYNGITYQTATKVDASFKTVKGEDGNTYLLWHEGKNDPQLAIEGSLANFIGGDTAVTYRVKMALAEGASPMATHFRVQETSAKNFLVFTTTESGDILLCGKESLKIGTLTNEFIEIIITVDFKNGIATAYDENGEIALSPDTGTRLSTSISKPSASEAKDLIDFISYTKYVFVCYAASATADRAMRIDDIAVYSGAYSVDKSDSTEIYYANVDLSNLPNDAPKEYDPEGETPLPTEIIGLDGAIFEGWYLDADFKNPIRSIPKGTKGAVVLYARLVPYFLEDFSENMVDVSNPDGITAPSYNIAVGGLTYYTSAKRGASFVTEKDTDGNSYLIFKKGDADPQINKDGALYDFLGTETSFTFKIDLAKNGDDAIIAFNMMLRVSGGNNFTVISSDSDGSIYLGHKGLDLKIGELGDEFATFTVTMDFKTGELVAYDEGGKVKMTDDGVECKTSVSVPSSSTAANMLEWLSTLKNYNFVFYAPSGKDASIRIDNVILMGGSDASGIVPEASLFFYMGI